MTVVVLQRIHIEAECLFCTNYDTTSHCKFTSIRYISPIPVLHLPHRAGPYAPFLSLPLLLSPPLSLTLSPHSLMSCMNVGVRVHVWPHAKVLHRLCGRQTPPFPSQLLLTLVILPLRLHDRDSNKPAFHTHAYTYSHAQKLRVLVN